MAKQKDVLEMELFRQQQAEMIEKYGYVIHAVPGESVHTHGLEESFSHVELECVLAADPNLISGLIHDLGERVKSGTRFAHNQVLTDLIKKFPVKLVSCPVGLRLILPDPAGELDRDRMQPEYASQYDGLDAPLWHKTGQA